MVMAAAVGRQRLMRDGSIGRAAEAGRQRRGDGGQCQDWAVDYDGEGRERAVSNGGDSGVAMMAAAKMAAA
jgi:hypothetical protein